MNRGSTAFLRVAVIIIGIPILALCIFLLPQIAMVATDQARQGATLAYVVFGILFIMYVTALYQALTLLKFIDEDEAFSQISVIALRKIKRCAIIISGLYILALPLIYVVAEWDDAPGLILIGMVIVGASAVVAVFAAVLQKLLQEAIRIKSENDLTV